jgi:hypothetical protein
MLANSSVKFNEVACLTISQPNCLKTWPTTHKILGTVFKKVSRNKYENLTHHKG